jgi:hypothetical protein
MNDNVKRLVERGEATTSAGGMMRIARVFPRRTSATPTDALAFTRVLEVQGTPDIDEIHISVAFTYDMPKAEWMEAQLRVMGVPVKMGGPAFGQPSGEFSSGMYVKPEITHTSRGCPNRCGFCSVWRRFQRQWADIKKVHSRLKSGEIRL